MKRHQFHAGPMTSPPRSPRESPVPRVGMWPVTSFLLRSGALLRSPRLRATLWVCSLVVGIVGQVVLVLITSYLIDLAISLMELWAELARKHLELTL